MGAFATLARKFVFLKLLVYSIENMFRNHDDNNIVVIGSDITRVVCTWSQAVMSVGLMVDSQRAATVLSQIDAPIRFLLYTVFFWGGLQTMLEERFS